MYHIIITAISLLGALTSGYPTGSKQALEARGSRYLSTSPRTLPMRYATTSLDEFADPAVLQHGGIWYAYATNNAAQHVQIATSTDFQTWTHLGVDALPTVGKWVDRTQPEIWAPDVIENGDGKFVMYYSAKLPSSSLHCVGAAVADRPEGPFVPRDETLICPQDTGGAIDASGFTDADGSRYVLMKVDGNSLGGGGSCNNMRSPIRQTPIMVHKMQKDGFTPDDSRKPFQILDKAELDGPLVEAPSIMRTPSGRYVLFFSSNCWSTDLYDISYAMSDKLEGPYQRTGPLAVTGTSGLHSPGGLSVASDGKHVVFHAGNGHGGRAMFTASIEVDEAKYEVTTV